MFICVWLYCDKWWTCTFQNKSWIKIRIRMSLKICHISDMQKVIRIRPHLDSVTSLIVWTAVTYNTQNFSASHIVNEWNRMPQVVTKAPSVNAFEYRRIRQWNNTGNFSRPPVTDIKNIYVQIRRKGDNQQLSSAHGQNWDINKSKTDYRKERAKNIPKSWLRKYTGNLGSSTCVD